MGLKRKAARLEEVDKKARSEAGLMVGLGGPETEQVMLEQVLREVRAPAIVQTNLDNWTQKIAGHLASCQLHQVSSVANIKNFPATEAEDVEFPGGKVTSCTPVGALKTKNLGDDKIKIILNVCLTPTVLSLPRCRWSPGGWCQVLPPSWDSGRPESPEPGCPGLPEDQSGEPPGLLPPGQHQLQPQPLL